MMCAIMKEFTPPPPPPPSPVRAATPTQRLPACLSG